MFIKEAKKWSLLLHNYTRGEIFKIKSSYDGLMLYGLIEEPKKKTVGIVQISHGMAENKERYKDFMKFLSNHGYIAVIHDYRGHGKSTKTEDNFGYFDENKNILKDELYEVTKFIKEKYPNLKSKLYPNMRHEILNEKGKELVYENILAFINDN